MSHNFVIVGGGLSGLSNAFFIKHFFPKAHITLIEQSNRVGGMIQTNKVDGFTCEEGPRSIRIGKYNHPLYHMIDKIGLYPEFIPSIPQPYSYIYWNGKLRSAPLKLNLETITQFVNDNGLGEALSLIKSYPGFYFNRSTTDNLGEYLESILGAELTEKYVESVYFGIYGESIYNLSKGLCFQKTHMQSYDQKKIEKELDLSDEFQQVKSKKLHGANSFRFVYGVDSLPKQIHRYLNENYSAEYNVLLNTKAKAINFAQKQLIVDNRDCQVHVSIPYDYLILNTPTHQMSQIMSNSNLHEIAEVFRNVKCNSIFTRNICWKDNILPKEFKGFGYLINPKQEQNILGMVADSLSFPGQYPNKATNLSIMSLYDVNDSVILKELSQHLGTTIPDPTHIVTKCWSKAFTQFAPGHQGRMNKVEEELNGKQVVIGGNNYTLAIPELVYMSYMKVKQLYV